jgi:phytoene desaturase
MRKRRAVIIGGGLGGLALSIRLASKGWSVTVCEQGESFGGKMNSWCAEGFRFDTGPSLITMPWIFAELFSAAGSAIEDHLELVPVQPICEYLYPDGTRFVYTSSMPEWLQTVRQLERGDVGGFLRFMKLGAQLYEVSKETFLRRRPLDWPRLTDRRVLKHFPWRYGWGNYHRTVAAHFKSPHLRQLYDRYPTYVGSGRQSLHRVRLRRMVRQRRPLSSGRESGRAGRARRGRTPAAVSRGLDRTPGPEGQRGTIV